MLFLLKKVIGAALMPLSIVLLLQLVALALRARRCPRASMAASLTGVILLFFAANEGVSDQLITSLELRYPPIISPVDGSLPPQIDQVRYILILGGGHNMALEQSATGRLSSGSLARLVEAVRLARLLPDAHILTCGPAPDHSPESHASVLARAANELGIDRSRITLLPDVRDTHDEVLAAQKIVGDSRVILVTSAWHMPRALGLAQGANLQAIPAPSDYKTSPEGNPTRDWFRWSSYGLERTTLATREYLGLAWTRLRGQR